MAIQELDEEAIFNLARKIDSPEAREGYLRQVCGGDDALRGRVQALLKVHDQEKSFLAAPASGPSGTVDEPPVPERPGSTIGPYKLLQQIGEGGMGTVFMAEQEQPVRRRVALKVIKPGMDSAQVIARFEAERQALAMMDHPNIAKVLDAGTTESGRPFFVMELVKGVPITKYCDQQHLTPRERLELFVPVCQALQHAHQKGVIHRDLKPSNVLIALYDGRPVPKVIDFGVAKALHQKLTDKTMFTEFGQVVGTLEYMSPEQAELNQLDIDTRSDVYALGVLLYELLTGSTPLDRRRLRQAAFDEMLRIIREEEPPKPSTRLSGSDELPAIAANRRTEPKKLGKLVRGELDWIVMKALEKDRSRRYETANGLARDLQRYLADEPVEACPPSAGYRLRKFARKHRALLGTASAFAALLLATAVVGTWLAVWALRAERRERAAAAAMQHERDRAVEAEQEATAQRDRATTAEADVRREADKANAINQFLIEDLLVQAQPEHNAPADRVTLLEVVDRAATKVGERFRDQPLVAASLRGTLGNVYHCLGEYAKADQHWSAALALRRRELGADHPDTYRALARFGHMLVHRRQLDESYGLLREAAAGLTRVLGADHPDTLKANASLADTLRDLGRHAEALPLWEQTFAKRQAVLGPSHSETLMSLKCLADTYEAAGQPDKALPLAEQALERAKAALGPDHYDTVNAMDTLASVYRAAGQLDKAQLLAEQVLEKTRARFGPDHTSTLRKMTGLAELYTATGQVTKALPLLEARLDRLKAKSNPDAPDALNEQFALGVAYFNAKQLDRSIPLFEDLLRRRRAKLGEDHPDTIWTALNLVANYDNARRLDDAKRVGAEWLARSRQKLGPDHRHTHYGLRRLARAYQEAKEFDRALPLYRELLDAQTRTLPVDHPDRTTTLTRLGQCLLDAGRPADAEPVLREVLQVRRRVQGVEHPDTLRAAYDLGMLYRKLRKYEQAEPLLTQALESQRKVFGGEDPRTLSTLDNLAALYQDAGQLDKALPLFEQVLEKRKAKFGPDHPTTLAAMNALAVAYRMAGRTQESVPLFEHTLKLRRVQLGPDHPETLSTMNSLAVAYWTAEQLDKSIPLFEETLRRQRAKLGDDHPSTILTAFNLGVNYRDAKRLDEALALFDEWLTRSRQKLGPDHPRTYYGLSRQAATYAQAKTFDRAVSVYRELLAAQSRKLPADDPDRANTLAALGECLLNAGQPADAEPVLRECLAIRKQKLPDDWQTFNAKALLGASLHGQKKYAEAEPLLLQGYAGLEQRADKVPARSKARLPEAAERLVQLYEATGRSEQAAEWRQKLPPKEPK